MGETENHSASASKRSDCPTGGDADRGPADGRLPLSDLTVLDLTQARAGPVAVRQLADWGADVIQIQAPSDQGREHIGTRLDQGDYQNLHRNKRSLNLDLKAAEGRNILLKLAERADIVVENFRPGVKRRLGIGYETLSERNPRLIYASISGFGQDGPYSDRPAFDQVIQGMGGLMSVTGLADQGPVRAGFAASDVLAGLYLAQAIFIALIERGRSGKGQWVQTSLIESMLAAMDFQAARVLVDGEVPEASGNDHPSSATMGAFPAQDGVVNIAVTGRTMFQALCEALGAEELLQNPDFASDARRLEKRSELRQRLSRHTENFTRDALVERLNAAGVPCGPIYDLREALSDPQIRHLGLAWPYDHESLGPRALVGQPIHLTRTPSQGVRSPPPTPGAQTHAILTEIGLSDQEIDRLKARRIV